VQFIRQPVWGAFSPVKEVQQTERAIITNIQGYSIHDGPGIRTVVFFKGCPLRCKWCSNPENLVPSVQVGFVEKLCRQCGRCLKACPHAAIVPGQGIYRINQEKCVACGLCVQACYYDALVLYGEEMTAVEVFAKVRRDKMFFDSSGGGVTASGGEPLLHPRFLYELFAKCREEGIGTCVETCGHVATQAFATVLPVVDQFLFDLKHMDNEVHREYTGLPNHRILENARFLVEQNAEVLFRMPLIPGVNDSPENIEATASFMKSLGPGGMNLQLMPFHRLGQSKYDALKMKYEFENVALMEASGIEAVKDLFLSLGINCTISR